MSVRLESICPPPPARRNRVSTRLRCSEDVAGRVSWEAMRSATRSPSPVRVGDVLLAAVPALVERALAPVQDADLASTLRRVVSKDLIARRPRSLAILTLGGALLAGTLAGCASTGTIADSDASSSTVEATPLGRRPIGAQGEAYDHYV